MIGCFPPFSTPHLPWPSGLATSAFLKSFLFSFFTQGINTALFFAGECALCAESGRLRILQALFMALQMIH